VHPNDQVYEKKNKENDTAAEGESTEAKSEEKK